MRKIKFKKVGAENFCNYVDPIELEFEDGKLILITGRNGVGKSALIQAIPFTLYGSCEKGRSDDVLNNRVNKNCMTFVEFEIGDDLYRVNRYVKYKSTGNSATISKNGIEYKKGSREVTAECEKILVPQKLFNNTMMFSQKVKTFFTDLTDAEQKDVFRKILQLDEFLEYYKAATEKISEIEKNVLAIDNSISSAELFLKDLQNQVIEYNARELVYNNEKTAKIIHLKSECDILFAEILGVETSINDIIKNYPKLEEDIQNLRTKLGEIKQELVNIDNLRDSELNNIFTVFENDKKTIEIEKNTEIKDLTSNKDSKLIDLKHAYETGIQKIDNDLKNKSTEIESLKNGEITKNTSDLQNKITELTQFNLTAKNEFIKINIDEIEKLTNQFNDAKNKITSSLNDFINEKIKNTSFIENQNLNINNLNKDIKKFENVINSDDKICPLCLKSMDDVTELQNHIDEINAEILKYTSAIEKSKLENVEIQNNIDKLNDNLEKMTFAYDSKKISIDQDNKNKLSGIINENNKTIEQHKNSIISLEAEIISKYNLEYNTFADELRYFHTSFATKYTDDCNLVINDFNSKIEILNQTIMTKLQKISTIADLDKSTIISKYESLKSDLQNQAIEISNKGNTLVPIFKNLSELQTDVQVKYQKLTSMKENIVNCENMNFDKSPLLSIENSINECNKNIEKYNNEKIQYNDLINIYNFWRIGFSPSGIQSMLIDEAIPFMNSRSSEYLEKISSGRYSLSFDTMKETKSGELKDKINVNVFDTLTLSDARIKFSGGQERIIDIATILTLGDLQEKIQDASFNILLFDEIFDTLDDENVRYVADLLKQIASEKTVVLISHRHINQIECDTHLNLN